MATIPDSCGRFYSPMLPHLPMLAVLLRFMVSRPFRDLGVSFYAASAWGVYLRSTIRTTEVDYIYPISVVHGFEPCVTVVAE